MTNKTPAPPDLRVRDALKDSLGGFAHALGGLAVDKVAEKTDRVTQRLTSYAEGSGPPAGKGAKRKGATQGKGAKKKAGDGSSLQEGLKATVSRVKEGVSSLKGPASVVTDKVTDVTDKISDVTGKAADVADKVTNVFGGGGAGKRGGFKFNNIVDAIDVGAPVDVVYDAWTEYDRWPEFMKKVESAKLDPEEGTVSFKSQVLWSHRQWDATIVDQVPGKRIVWDSTGPKGHLSGVVTFHPLGEDLTRIVLVVEYYPSGFVEKTANIWRAVNRRLRLELKLFVRYVMTDVVLHPDDVEGYRAEILDEEVVRSHDEVIKEEVDEEPQEAPSSTG